MRKKIFLALIYLAFSETIFPQDFVTFYGGYEVNSLTSAMFTQTRLEEKQHNFTGYLLGISSGSFIDRVGAQYSLEFSNTKSNTVFRNKNYTLTNSKISLQLSGLFAVVQDFLISITGDIGVGWLGSDTPFDHSGFYGVAAIGTGPTLFISRFKIFALANLNIGYLYFSGSDPDINSIDPFPSSNGLILGSSFKVGVGVGF
jgi:hypothetical protein